MRVQTTHTNLYKYAELPGEVKATVLDNLRDINTGYELWHEGIDEDVTTAAALMGIEIDKILFTGFWNQGDGACFEGSYQYKKGSVKAIEEYAPKDEILQAIAKKLREVQLPYFYRLTANIKHRGYYYHEYCTDIDVDLGCTRYSDTFADTEKSIAEELRKLMRWIYTRLQNDYEYLTSNESVEETIENNEYEFDIDGRPH